MQRIKRILSLLLCSTLLFLMMPQVTFAEESTLDNNVSGEANGLCEHHTEHDETCGYNEEEGTVCHYICEVCKANEKSQEEQELPGVQENEQELQPLNDMARSVPSETLESHIVTDKVSDPQGAIVNLFDYWVNDTGEVPNGGTTPKGDLLTKDHSHVREKPSAWGNSSAYSSENDWWRGINENHLLLFGDGVIHAGLWNKGAGETSDYGKQYAGMEGIVKPILINGYPSVNIEAARQRLTGDETVRNWKLVSDCMLTGDHIDTLDSPGVYTYDSKDVQNFSNTLIQKWENATGQTIDNGTESLNYLFDPSISHDYKKSYQNVRGLFQLNDEGYYYYNMRENFAEFRKNETTVVSEEPSGKVEQHSDGNFILYDAPATVRTDAEKSVGNFFPFNTAQQVFDGVDAQGKLTSSVNQAGNEMNHHFGMTVDVDFRQPLNGLINMGTAGNKHMTFEFSGDDDVWVYIDDVLVLDLGGVHSEIYGLIDFATGDVFIGQSFDSKGIPEYDLQADGSYNTPDHLVTRTTLKALFEAAGVDTNTSAWRDNTFASNTDHKLNMYYLERGNYDSSLAMYFNLQPRLYQQIKKVDQNGDPIENVEFDLYEAKKTGETYEAVGEALASLKTGKDGIAVFEEIQEYQEDGTPVMRPFNFADRYTNQNIEYYILKETKPAEGYRALPNDVVLQYNNETTMLIVANRYLTGAYASFISNIIGNSHVTYGSFSPATGQIEPSSTAISEQAQKEGLILAVPMLRQDGMSAETGDGKWVALYGSNTKGLSTIIPETRTAFAWRKAILHSALYQALDADTPGWYLEWNTDTKRLEGTLSDLPGRADRYQLIEDLDSDMKMVYAIIEPAVFEKLGITGESSQARYQAFAEYVQNAVQRYLDEHKGEGKTSKELTEAAIEEIGEQIYMTPADGGAYEMDGAYQSRGFSFLNTDQFIRNFRSLLYIPNEQRELRVWKVDQNGKGVNGVEFTLYRDIDGTDEEGNPIRDTVAARGITANVDGLDGVLVFRPPVKTEEGHLADTAPDGYAWTSWVQEECDRYYLKETNAPEGYDLNSTKIPVIVGRYSIYADAGTPDNGVTVMAGVGKLVQTMVKYAADENVNITLRDITAYAQQQASGSFDLEGWEDMKLEGTEVKRYLNLHYGANAMISYGLHDEDGGQTMYPFFVTDSGFLRARVEQNYAALTVRSPYAKDRPNYAQKDDISGQDITSLFSLLNIVVVTDQKDNSEPTGKLLISKTIQGSQLEEADYTRNFEFEVSLKDAEGNALPGEYYFYGTNRSGYIRDGGAVFLHHDESITILGLPEGTKWAVSETQVKDWYVSASTGVIEGTIEEDQTSIAAFINTNTEVEMGNLKIRKLVSGEGAEPDRDFSFIITLQDEQGNELTGSYRYEGDKRGELRSGDTVTLHHNETIEIIGLPAYTQYIITEEKVAGYVLTAENDRGAIIKNETITALFHNERKDGEESDPDSSMEQPENPNDPSDPSDPSSGRPATGDAENAAVWMLMLSLSLILLCVMKRLAKKKA